MNIYIFIFIAYVMKVIYDFNTWIYGYLLRIKWVSYFNQNNNNAIGYTHQIRTYLSNAHLSNYYDDIFSRYNKDKICLSFIEAHGYYRHKLLLNFWPYYWLKTLFNLPKNVITYLGFNRKKKDLKLFNIISWLIGAICYIYNDEIVSFSKQLINSIFEILNK